MAKGLYYYKLVSPYEEDVTKNCKLTVNEIDSNFLNLKDEDIKSAELDEEANAVVLTRNNGDKLVADLTPILSGSVYDLNIVYENSSSDEESCKGANIYITYTSIDDNGDRHTVTVPIKGLVTLETMDKILGEGLLRQVVSDGSLSGKGTMSSPLGISEVEKNRPAIDIIDIIKGDKLPEPEDLQRGDRYITKEILSDFGFLYSYHDVKKINENLAAEGRGWRVPTKEDWDCLLNSIEACDYRDYDSTMCHQIFGKYAGNKLKSKCGWVGQKDCECKTTKPISGLFCGYKEDEDYADDESFDVDCEEKNHELDVVKADYVGTDEYGMRILPTGIGDGDEVEYYFSKKTAFWTTTHVYNDVSQDIYVKEFDWNKSGVIQEAYCPDTLLSIRLVKDYDGNNHYDSEVIDGVNYKTILFPDCGAVWTASNFAGSKGSYTTRKAVNNGWNPYNKVVYYVNVWNGAEWEKRQLVDGETIVINEADSRCQYNVEYRVFVEDGCNQVLVNTDDTAVERVLDRLLPLIYDEKTERENADKEIYERIDSLESDLKESIETEQQEREKADEILHGLIEDEITKRENSEQLIWDVIDKERQARETTDQEIWQAIEKEAELREQIDNEQWEAIVNEIKTREEVDNEIWSALNNEILIREKIDDEQWDKINEEIERSTKRDEEIDGQLIDTDEEYVLKVFGGLILKQKNGNAIEIKIDGNYGEI